MHFGLARSLLPTGDRPTPPPGRSAPRKRLSSLQLATPILIIEDEMMIAWMVQSVLEDLGFSDLAIASSGEQAKADASRIMPGLIISDINLGAGCDGIEASAAISGGGAIPVLFISAYADNEARERIARDIPAARFLAKPVGITELQDAVEALLIAASGA